MKIEDYVSFEVAKLLTEKGYPATEDRILLQDAQKWLRENKNIHLEMRLGGITWSCFVKDMNKARCIETIKYAMASTSGETYEEALNEGIKEALKYI